MDLLTTYISVAVCISVALADDLAKVLQRLDEVETKARTYEARIDKLLSRVQRQDDVIADMQKENARATVALTSLAEKLQESSDNDVLRPKRFVVDPEVPVAFHAVMTGSEHPHFGPNQRIVFDTQLLNIGGGYDRLQGLFTAPEKGIYVFSLSVMSFNTLHTEIAATIMTNGRAAARTYAHGDSGRHDQGSVTVTVQLEAGDQVCVENYVLKDVSLYGDSYSSFTGYLLVPQYQ